jgi:hypothetical protein
MLSNILTLNPFFIVTEHHVELTYSLPAANFKLRIGISVIEKVIYTAAVCFFIARLIWHHFRSTPKYVAVSGSGLSRQIIIKLMDVGTDCGSSDVNKVASRVYEKSVEEASIVSRLICVTWS